MSDCHFSLKKKRIRISLKMNFERLASSTEISITINSRNGDKRASFSEIWNPSERTRLFHRSRYYFIVKSKSIRGKTHRESIRGILSVRFIDQQLSLGHRLRNNWSAFDRELPLKETHKADGKKDKTAGYLMLSLQVGNMMIKYSWQ